MERVDLQMVSLAARFQEDSSSISDARTLQLARILFWQMSWSLRDPRDDADCERSAEHYYAGRSIVNIHSVELARSFSTRIIANEIVFDFRA